MVQIGRLFSGGGVYGVLISIEKFFHVEKTLQKIPVAAHIYTMFFVIIGWVFFRADSLGQAVTYLSVMFGLHGNPLSDGGILLLKQFWFFLLLGIVLAVPIRIKEKDNLMSKVFYIVGMLTVFIFALIFVVKGGYSPFIYFNF